MRGKKKVDWPLAIAAAVFTIALFIWRSSQ